VTILEFKKYFKSELSEWYSESESTFLYQIFAEKITGFEPRHQRKFSHQQLLISDEEELKNILAELKTGKPYQHILGETEFYGMKFFVNENVLIPRPETEELLEFTINRIQDTRQKIQGSESEFSDSSGLSDFRTFKILDIGTGSGIIPIVLKKYFPEAEISSIDISEKALEIARKNSDFHQTEIRFIQKDFLNENLDETFDIIISNPPYIGIDEQNEIAGSVKEFEPEIALFSPDSNSLVFYEKIAKDCENHLSKNGFVFLEINQKLGKETLELFQHFSESLLLKDISGNDRIVFVRK